MNKVLLPDGTTVNGKLLARELQLNDNSIKRVINGPQLIPSKDSNFYVSKMATITGNNVTISLPANSYTKIEIFNVDWIANIEQNKGITTNSKIQVKIIDSLTLSFTVYSGVINIKTSVSTEFANLHIQSIDPSDDSVYSSSYIANHYNSTSAKFPQIFDLGDSSLEDMKKIDVFPSIVIGACPEFVIIVNLNNNKSIYHLNKINNDFEERLNKIESKLNKYGI